MSITSAKDITIRNGRVDLWAIKSGAKVYSGGFVALTSDGLAVDGSSSITANTVAIGIGWDTAPSGKTATANGSLAGGVISDPNNVIKVYTEGQAEVSFNTLGQANVGDLAYLKDNGTLTVSSSQSPSNVCVVGTVTKYISSTKGEVNILGYNKYTDVSS